MKKVFLSVTLIIVFAIYVIHEKTEGAEAVKAVAPKGTPTTATADTPAVQPTSTQTNSGYKDGEHTGEVTDAYYGNIQVKAVIQGGKITDVQFLQYPNDRQTSIEINQQAMPYLKSEAIQSQRAQVDIVSGATQTSEAFVKSLQSALDQAKS
jgi:uncharacterized protein with FMN-binding domain